VSGDLKGVPKTVDTDDYLIVSEAFDMGYAGQKTIMTVESDMFSATSKQAAIDYTNDNQSFNTSNYTPMNNQGIASIIVSGNAFRVRMKMDQDVDARIGYIKARYKMTDLRGIRGVYAPPPRGQ
jgi:hypothetical protein